MKKLKDEIIFLQNLEKIVGSNFLKSHKLNRKILGSDIFFEKDFREYNLNDELNEILKNLLIDFECNFKFSSGTLHQYIDGFVNNHPKYGSRIIEFDEEQHFTPFRLYSLNKISSSLDLVYTTEFIELCENLEYFNNEVLKKHRVKLILKKVPTDISDFRKILEKYAYENYTKKDKKISGYIRPKKEFPFIGGRIAQRAYFDILREIAPLSPKNDNLEKTVRISKNKFERMESNSFHKISSSRIKEIISKELERQTKQCT